MASGNREDKVIHAVACSECGAAIGQPCGIVQDRPDALHRPRVHTARRQAWQALRDRRRPALLAELATAASHEGDASARELLAWLQQRDDKIREVIDLLDQTRHTFRSKQIERARELLEDLI